MAPKVHEIKFKTRYAETDQMGYIHHSIYAQYYEMGRIDLMEQIGISYKQMEKDGYILPVYHLATKYLIPLTFDELITLKTKVNYLTGVRLSFGYEIFNEAGQKATEGEVVLVFAGSDGKPIRPPKQFVDKIMTLL
ncbi:MAG TPA: acyl-CoA thioesterase [Flavobacteriales bacterium]|jgi:acyl-CoA thioester hydrolase|nr:acyl-CoA thioesterase [Flavobacteriales bacterium]